MNKKGFTLVEMLATIVILSVVMGIATYGVLGVIQSSKLKNEKIFLNRLGDVIEIYLTRNGSSLKKSEQIDIDKEKKIYLYRLVSKENKHITIKTLIDEKLVNKDDLINPANKKKCFDFNQDDNYPEIVIFKDNNFVYYYYVDLSNITCDISEENQVISKMPVNIINGLMQNGVELPEALKKKVNGNT